MSNATETDDYSLNVFSLEGRSAVVTGAASGIGRSTAILFARAGARVVVSDVDGEGAAKVAREIVEAGGKAISATCDISDEVQVRALFDTAQTSHGGVDTLANVAAYRTKHRTMTMSVADWDIMHAVTTRGTFLCLREAVKLMRASGRGGTIVNVSSIASFQPVVLNSMNYDSAKAGVNAMTRAAALEFAADNIRVNAIAPGATVSGGKTQLDGERLVATGPITQPGRILLQRFAQPIEQARAILFLASPASSYITGQVLPVDGGVLIG